MAKQDHTLLLVGGAGAAFAVWKWIYEPWKLAQDLNAPTGSLFPPSSGGGGGSPSPLPYIPSPTPVYPVGGPSTPSIPNPLPQAPLPGGQQGSIVDPRVTPGGDVGQAMWRKGWTQQVASDRLTAIKNGYAQQKAYVSQLQAAGGGIPEAQAELAKYDAAISAQMAEYNRRLSIGDQAGANAYAESLTALRQGRSEISNRIAAAQSSGSSQVNAYLSSMAALNADYNALTGYGLQ